MKVPRIDFYVLNTDHLESKQYFIARLIEKIYLKHHDLFVWCDSKPLAEEMDAWLWRFDPSSIIPHALLEANLIPAPPIQITWTPPNQSHYKILLNLNEHTAPEQLSQFDRILEVVHDDLATKKRGRARYRAYQAKGWPIQTHPIDCHQIGVAHAANPSY